MGQYLKGRWEKPADKQSIVFANKWLTEDREKDLFYLTSIGDVVFKCFMRRYKQRLLVRMITIRLSAKRHYSLFQPERKTTINLPEKGNWRNSSISQNEVIVRAAL